MPGGLKNHASGLMTTQRARIAPVSTRENSNKFERSNCLSNVKTQRRRRSTQRSFTDSYTTVEAVSMNFTELYAQTTARKINKSKDRLKMCFIGEVEYKNSCTDLRTFSDCFAHIGKSSSLDNIS